jgi:hypothetical protein
MTKDDIIRMAREAGMRSTFVCADPNACPDDDECCHKNVPEGLHGRPETIERFAALVYAEGHKDGLDDFEAGVLPAAIKAEREACAKVCEVGTGEPIQMKALEMLRQERERIAKAIRARGDALTRLNKAAEDNGEEL